MEDPALVAVCRWRFKIVNGVSFMIQDYHSEQPVHEKIFTLFEKSVASLIQKIGPNRFAEILKLNS